MNQWTVWEPCFPDTSFDILLTSPSQPSFLTCFFLGTHTHTHTLKAKVYMNKHHTLEELKQYFRDEITVTDKFCSKQLWLISNQNYRNVPHARETTFLSQHGVDVCLLTETHLRSGETLQMANYVCHRTDRLTEGGGTAVPVCWGINHYTEPIQGVRHLEDTDIQVTLASKLVKILGWSTCHHASLSSIWTCLPALVAVFPFWWWVTWMTSMCNGILGWS